MGVDVSEGGEGSSTTGMAKDYLADRTEGGKMLRLREPAVRDGCTMRTRGGTTGHQKTRRGRSNAKPQGGQATSFERNGE